MIDSLFRKDTYQLSDSDVRELFRIWQRDRDERARDQLVSRFLPLAYKLARRYHTGHEPVSDLRQVAAMGLLKAIERFDLDREINFASFATPCVLGEIRRYYRDCGWSVHIPRSVHDLVLKVEKGRRELERTNAFVTAPMLAQYLEISVEEVVDALEAKGAHYALSMTVHPDDETGERAIEDAFGVIDDGFRHVELSVDLSRAASSLSDQERAVLHHRFVADQTQAVTAGALGVSQMQISRIERKALADLRAVFDDADRPRAEENLSEHRAV